MIYLYFRSCFGKDVELTDMTLSSFLVVFLGGLSRLVYLQEMHYTCLLCLSCMCPSPSYSILSSTVWHFFIHTDFLMCHHPCSVRFWRFLIRLLPSFPFCPWVGPFRVSIDARVLQRAARFLSVLLHGSLRHLLCLRRQNTSKNVLDIEPLGFKGDVCIFFFNVKIPPILV